MEQFALIGMEGSESRYILSHPVLRFLPTKWAKALIPKAQARFTENIYREDIEDERGYIVDVPEFFLKGDKLSGIERVRILDNLMDTLESKEIKILVFPLWRDFITLEEKLYLEENSIVLLDGSVIRLVSLMSVVERLFTIIKAKPNEVEVSIWGADNRVGQVWARLLGPRLNYLGLGGQDGRVLEELSNEILYETGLSCQVFMDPNQCLRDRTIIILSSIPHGWNKPDNIRVIVSSYGLSYGHGHQEIMLNNSDSIFVESGWATLPHNMKINNDLGVWDMMGIAETILFIGDDVYRKLLLDNPLTLENLDLAQKIMVDKGVSFSGMISNCGILTYSGFRRVYFGNSLDN